MSTPQFLDANGLAKYHKEVVDRKVDRIIGKGLSTNDLTNKLKSNYDAAFTHSLVIHAPEDAEKNQNAFAEIKVGESSVGAENPSDVLTIKGEGNIAVTITDASPHKYITFNTTGLSSVATSGLYDDLVNKPLIPTKTSDLTNDSGFITGYVESDPTVPAWAKAETKPQYTADEVGALPSSTIIPSKLSELTVDDSHQTVTAAEKTKWNGMMARNLPEFPSDASIYYIYGLRARIMPGDTTPTYYWEAVEAAPVLAAPDIYLETD